MLPLSGEVIFGFSEHAFAVFTTIVSDIFAVRHQLCFDAGKGGEYSDGKSAFFGIDESRKGRGLPLSM